MTKRKPWGVVAVCVLVLLFVCLITAGTMYIIKSVQNVYTMQIAINGDSTITLEYGEKYEEPGCSAYFSGTHFNKEPISVEVSAVNSVDEQKTGEYLLKYIATHKGITGTAYRRVRIVDTEKPVITLTADPEKYTLPTEKYEEEGFSAVDNYDGDITQQVKRTETKEAITYTVTDASGNTATVVRKIIYDDPIAPTLVLKGKKSITIKQGKKYKEPGYTAMDNCDGDLTKKVKITGKVNVDEPGTYTLQYSVVDAYKNKTTVARVVEVKAKKTAAPQPDVVEPTGKVIYLTFDDGPGPRTPELLDILKEYNVKATFFVMNTDYVDTIKRIAKEGHSLGIHTASHNYKKIYASEKAYFKDLNKMKGIIEDLTGVETTLIRFPGGSSNTISSFNSGIMTRLTKAVKKKGYQYFDWNVDSNDAGGAYTAQQVYSNVISGVQNYNTSIVLQHDVKGFSIDAVEDIIIWGLNNGYTFLPLDAKSPGCHHGINN